MQHSQLHFTLILTGVVNPLGDSEDDHSLEAMTPALLERHLNDAVESVIIGNGLITGDTLGTLDSHAHTVSVWEVGEGTGDFGLTADQLDAKYNPAGNGEHPDYPREAWREEVAADATLLGYWLWVVHQIEAFG